MAMSHDNHDNLLDMEPWTPTRPSTPTPTQICSRLQQLAKVDQYSTFVKGSASSSEKTQRNQERKTEEREEQRSHRLSTMVQHARGCPLNVTEEPNFLQIQTFYTARTFIYPVVEEHNCGEMSNICLKSGGLYFEAEKNARGTYTCQGHAVMLLNYLFVTSQCINLLLFLIFGNKLKNAIDRILMK
ncbi:uncharacterized protein TNIN_244111 [Trichonephila inaurata madagascariensis]|uniref:Uncharacterized protein n=1 Tax=Trichonephila inaurata madagascariensis TaxID=2747483 RepID=A0A8X6YYX2_9ARAC|nr:uncharacterized protein TNIN_244111 [Trichonephila inaurata madagascariensis]